MKIPILRLRDKAGKEIVIPAIRGEKGEKGEKGDSASGDMLTSVYDPNGKAEDIFDYVDSAIANLTPVLNTETWTFELEDGSTVTKAVYVK